MSTSSAESIPLGPAPSHHNSLSPSQDNTLRTASPFGGSTGSGSTAVSNHFDRVRPAAAIGRYERTARLEPPYLDPDKDLQLEPFTTSFVDKDEPKDWVRLAHPEGALYWVCEYQLAGRKMPVYTDAFLCDPKIREEIEKFRDVILSKIDVNRMPPEWELVLDLVGDDLGGCVCSYYFVNPSNRTLFWLHIFDARQILNGLNKIKSKRRIQQALEYCYWTHWEMFPHDREVPEELLQELVGIMMHAGLDDMTSHSSTSVYSGEEFQKYISHVERIRFVGSAGGFSACVVGRLMKFFYFGRYINFFGQHEARLSNDQSVFSDKDNKRRTWLIKSMSVWLFFTPEVHLEALDAVYTDFIVCQHKWDKFIQRVQNEWRELVRIGTVLLTANVAFLAIPSVDSSIPGSNASAGGPVNGIGVGSYVRNPAQVTSFMSIIFSMGCMVTGQLLLRHHLIRPHDSAEQVDRYLRSYHDPNRGLETLAILYSLPQSSLLWAIASFFVAFIFVALIDSKGNWQRYSTLAVTAIVVAFLSWSLWATWERRINCTNRVRGLLKRAQARDHGRYGPLHHDRAHPRQHDGQETAPFQSVHVD